MDTDQTSATAASSDESISQRFLDKKAFFATGQTHSLKWRMEMLSKLEDVIVQNEKSILEALYKDLKKPEHEAWMSEIGVTLEEIRFTKKNLAKWMKPKSVRVTLPLLPSRAKIHYEPLGVVLIIGPWNYPFQLAIAPLIGAIAAGNCAIIKPSELTTYTSNILYHLVSQTFQPEYVCVIEGGIPETTALLEKKFDHIFFTGSTPVGKVVMQAAARNLVPVTLELGGKSPVVVDAESDVDLAARRIVWGKYFNAGQTCVAPDYVLVHESVSDQLLEKMRLQIKEQFGEREQESKSYARIVNRRNHQRLNAFINPEQVYCGGQAIEGDLYIQPTILTKVDWEDKVMKEEIFGPILPVMTYSSLNDAFAAIRSQPKPLSAYFFSQSKTNQQRFLDSVSFGGACINDVMAHLSNPHLPFGGVGESGIGHYHGHASFLTFSHSKSVLRRYGFLDVSARYAPYSPKKTRLVKKLFGF